MKKEEEEEEEEKVQSEHTAVSLSFIFFSTFPTQSIGVK